ncbi:SWF/SNF helicase family protein [Nocardiopsis sp. ARC36]
MHAWALTHEAQPDAKARRLIDHLKAICKPDKHWTNERVVVFTEYRDTQSWLRSLLAQAGLGGEQVKEMHGGMGTEEREALRVAFQKDPTEHPLRILIATDAASEGIDLQRHCHRLVNYDIPFNPTSWSSASAGSTGTGRRSPRGLPLRGHRLGEGDRLLRGRPGVPGPRGHQGRPDGGGPGLGQRGDLRRRAAPDAGPERGPGRRDRQGRREGPGPLRLQHPRPGAPAAPQPGRDRGVARPDPRPGQAGGGHRPGPGPATAAAPHTDEDEDRAAQDLYEVPSFTGSWVKAADGLLEKASHGTPQDAELRQLPVTFNARTAKGRDDVVLAHLNHPLVSRSIGLLRTAVSNDRVGLNRVTAVVSEDPELEDVLVGAYSRFVLVGADGVRLHEEVLHSGGWLPETGRFRRLENLGTLGGILNRALDSGRPLSDPVWNRMRERWERAGGRAGLERAIEWRADTRLESLKRVLAERQENERARVTGALDQFAASLREALAGDDDENALFGRSQTQTKEERDQYRKDRVNWEKRLAALDGERERELEAIAERYARQDPHTFPVAVVFVVP